MNKIVSVDKVLLDNVCHIIDEARQNVASAANSALTMMYWHIGDIINSHVLVNHRAEYGQQIVSALSTQLTELYGKDFSSRNLRRMIQFSQSFPDRKLRRLIAIDLKRTRFKPAYKGQMELYLRYLDKYERAEGEESPLGLLLCTEGSDEQIELLQLEDTGIKVAQYFTELPSKEVLQAQLRKQIESARLRIENT